MPQEETLRTSALIAHKTMFNSPLTGSAVIPMTPDLWGELI